ncbi:MAG TPA: helix-turn-helix domain-containing protein [Verrucomicrobiae bacterium]|nr:helix-turn-helix domain-containing protein [Verrucomicrobiae bacterium]
MNNIMSQVAEKLRQAREALHLTINQVADVTKIRTDHLRALEEGNFAVFSAPVYIRGSVKNYARVLKLDEAQMLAALDAELNQTEKFSEPPPLVEAANPRIDYLLFLLSKFNWKWGAAAGAVVGLILIAMLIGSAFKHHSKRNPLAGLPPAVYQTANNAGNTLPLTSHR